MAGALPQILERHVRPPGYPPQTPPGEKAMNTMTEDCVLELTRIFDAPPERVFDAWLEKSWGEWAGPPGVRGEVMQMEPRVGGGYRIVMHRDTGDLSVSGTYKEIARPSRIKMTWK